MSCIPSLPNQFLITGAYSLLDSSCVSVSRMFVTSISKLSNSIYLSLAFQLNKTFLGPGHHGVASLALLDLL